MGVNRRAQALPSESKHIVYLVCISLLKGHNKMPQARWLKQQKFISHSSGGWEVLDQGAGKVGFILRPLLLVCRQSLSCCVLTSRATSLCTCGARVREWRRRRERENAPAL